MENERVSDRIGALLARAEGVRLARDLPTTFDAKGEAAARRIAAADAGRKTTTGPSRPIEPLGNAEEQRYGTSFTDQ